MKFLFDLFPVLLFFTVDTVADMNQVLSQSLVNTYMGRLINDGNVSLVVAPALIATVVAMAASFLQIAYIKLRGRKIDGMLWTSVAVITIFGSATIYFHNVAFIKMKPTILYASFALGMLVTQLLFKKNMMRSAMEATITLPEQVWDRLSYAYIAFFLLQALLNLFVGFVVYPTEEEFGSYAAFKAFGQPAIFLVFIVFQTIYLSRHIEEEKA
jgi:intracellular septation protein